MRATSWPDRCVVAFVGAGNMAAEHMRAFRDVPGVELGGIFSRTRERARALAAKHGAGSACQSIAELYEASRADLVVVAVSELSVREIAEECFAFPWTCLIEKPAGYDLADAEALAASARARGRRAHVALNRRHYASTRNVLADLATDTGARFIHVQDQEDPAAALAAGRPRLVVENWMYANSIHLVDFFSFMGRGAITSVVPVVRWNPDEPGVVVANVLYDSGDVGLYQAVWNRPGPWAVSATTPSRRWELRPVERAALQLRGHRTLESVEPHEWDVLFKPGLRSQAGLAVRAAAGANTPELPTLDEALASMRITHAIYDPG